MDYKRYWLNLFQYYAVVAFLIYVFGTDLGHKYFDLEMGLSIVGTFTIIVLGHKIARSFGLSKTPKKE